MGVYMEVNYENIRKLLIAEKITTRKLKEVNQIDQTDFSNFLLNGNSFYFTREDGIRKMISEMDFQEILQDVKGALIEFAIGSINTPLSLNDSNIIQSNLILWANNLRIGIKNDEDLEVLIERLLKIEASYFFLIPALENAKKMYINLLNQIESGRIIKKTLDIINILEQEKQAILRKKFGTTR